MDNLTKQLLFKAHFIDLMPFSSISEEFKIERKLVSDSYQDLKIEMQTVLTDVKRLRNLYSNKKSKFGDKFQFKDFPSFYQWYTNQEHTCFYCKSDQYKIHLLVSKGSIDNQMGLTSKRFEKRGKSIEIDRKDSKSNIYNETNCVLSCYFCNNDKSDYILSEEYIKYFGPVLSARKAYIDYKYEELLKQQQVQFSKILTQ